MAKKSKYSPRAQKKIEQVMREFQEGKLRSADGKQVTDRQQALAIALSQARERGLKVPKKK